MSRAYDTRARDLRCGLDRLFSKQSQAEHRLPVRTLRRRCELMWSLWSPVPMVDEVHHVVQVCVLSSWGLLFVQCFSAV